MNGLENLVVGKEYRYKELCALFGEKVKNGGSQKAQLRKWDCFFRWSKPTSQKYKIEEIRELPKEKFDGRKNNGGNSTTKFPLLEDILMDYFIDKKGIKCTLPTLATEIGILSDGYIKYRYNVPEFSENNDINEEIIYVYLGCIRTYVASAIESAIERLNRKGFIKSKKYYVLVLENGGKKFFYEENSKEILLIENCVLAEMRISRVQLSQPKYSSEFYRKVNELLSDKIGQKVKYHFKEYEIKLINDNYQKTSTDDIGRTTRKFIISIGISMFKYIHKNFRKFEEYGISQEKLLTDVMELSNYFFVHMDSNSWDKFMDDDEFKNENYANVFFTQYCLVKMQNELDRKIKR